MHKKRAYCDVGQGKMGLGHVAKGTGLRIGLRGQS